MNNSEEKRREKARTLRYKKPIVKDLSLELMEQNIYDMQSAAADVQWAYENDLADDLLGEDEAEEFKTMFSVFENDLERLLEDIKDDFSYIPENYEDLLVAVNTEETGMDLLGYDSYEGDYFGIDGWERPAAEEATKRLMRLTKEQLITTAQQSFAIAFQYIGLQTRYELLKGSIDVLRAESKGFAETAMRVNELHEKAFGGESWAYLKRTGHASAARRGEYVTKEIQDFDRLLQQFDPYSRVWVE